MIESNPSVRIVLTTVGSREEAARIGRALVEEHLVACATILPGAESIYRWRDTIETESETLLMLKTDAENLPALESRVRELHNYETPEFLVIQVDAASDRYLRWMNLCLAHA
jgi:periplasmic divalent cation tolerance protein